MKLYLYLRHLDHIGVSVFARTSLVPLFLRVDDCSRHRYALPMPYVIKTIPLCTNFGPIGKLQFDGDMRELQRVQIGKVVSK